MVSSSQRNSIFIFMDDLIIDQVYYYLFRSQLCSVEDGVLQLYSIIHKPAFNEAGKKILFSYYG